MLIMCLLVAALHIWSLIIKHSLDCFYTLYTFHEFSYSCITKYSFHLTPTSFSFCRISVIESMPCEINLEGNIKFGNFLIFAYCGSQIFMQSHSTWFWCHYSANFEWIITFSLDFISLMWFSYPLSRWWLFGLTIFAIFPWIESARVESRVFGSLSWLSDSSCHVCERLLILFICTRFILMWVDKYQLLLSIQ